MDRPLRLANGTPTTRHLDLKDVVDAGMMTSGRKENTSFPSTFNHLLVARATMLDEVHQVGNTYHLT